MVMEVTVVMEDVMKEVGVAQLAVIIMLAP
jgi:hypothetical protein